jgi:hypothetical protein
MLTVVALASLASCGPTVAPTDTVASKPVEAHAAELPHAHLLLHPTSDPEALVGRAVHLTGRSAWSIADARSPACEVNVKRSPAQFASKRTVDLQSFTAVSVGFADLVGLEARYGKDVNAEIDVRNTEVLEADVHPSCGDFVIDRVFVGTGRRMLRRSSTAAGEATVPLGPVTPGGSLERNESLLDTMSWDSPQAYGFSFRHLAKTPPLKLTVDLPATVTDGDEISFAIESSKPAYLVVFYQESDGKASVLWPSAEEPEPASGPGAPARLPSARERQAGIALQAQLREPRTAARELLVIYGFTEKSDYDSFKPPIGGEAADGPAYVSKLAGDLRDIPMARWSRVLRSYSILPRE